MIAQPNTMFREIYAEPPRRRRFLASFSVTLHLCLLVWLLRAPSPTFLAPHSLVRGVRTGSATALFFPTHMADSGTGLAGSRPAKSPMAARARITWTKSRNVGKSRERDIALSKAEDSKTRAASDGGASAPPLGSPYGSVSQGAISGFEIRPALWASGADPRLTPEELNNLEGTVIVEITIDEQGNVVRTAVLQSLSPPIDAKVVATLENWRFHPATRDGMAVASKQDVYYHFPLRR